MAYTLKNCIIRAKNKFIYKFGVHFPYSPVRAKSIRALGWKCGKNAYIADDLIITQNYVYYRSELEIGMAALRPANRQRLRIQYIMWMVWRNVVDHTPSLFFKSSSMEISKEVARFLAGIILEQPSETIVKATCIKDGEIIDKRIRDYQSR